MRDADVLARVTKAANRAREARTNLEEQARAWVEEQAKEWDEEVHAAVLHASDNGHRIVDIARALSPTRAKNPNRNAVYAILHQYADRDPFGDLPFEWVPREVETRNGSKTVFDLHATLGSFGPLSVTGEFVWRYDEAERTLEPVLTDGEPYPQSDAFYQRAIEQWVRENPYPEERT